MQDLISATNVSRISSGLVVHSFIICLGEPADITVTADIPCGKSLSSARDNQFVFSSSSAIQKLNFPGWPRVERSTSPGLTSNKLQRINANINKALMENQTLEGELSDQNLDVSSVKFHHFISKISK